MEKYLLISDAAKHVHVESHVLRYWEEELELPIKRNEQGHRYYTEEDIDRFVQIKSMKERGLQLKAIKMILQNGKLEVLTQKPTDVTIEETDNREEKVKKLQWVLQQMMKQAIQENNAQLVQDIKESVLKELDYQFRIREEQEEEREKRAIERSEVYYRKVDELLRKKSTRGHGKGTEKVHDKVYEKVQDLRKEKGTQPEEKKKRHFIL